MKRVLLVLVVLFAVVAIAPAQTTVWLNDSVSMASYDKQIDGSYFVYYNGSVKAVTSSLVAKIPSRKESMVELDNGEKIIVIYSKEDKRYTLAFENHEHDFTYKTIKEVRRRMRDLLRNYEATGTLTPTMVVVN